MGRRQEFDAIRGNRGQGNRARKNDRYLSNHENR